MLSLEQTLTYENTRVLNKFRTRFAVDAAEAREVATETHRWLWLNAHARLERGTRGDIPGALVIHQGMLVLDEYWHTFILHTADYAAFCGRCFGFFIHHSPGSPDFVPRTDAENERQLGYVYDVLGAPTLARWYEDYAVRYSAQRLSELERPTVYGRACEQVP